MIPPKHTFPVMIRTKKNPTLPEETRSDSLVPLLILTAKVQENSPNE